MKFNEKNSKNKINISKQQVLNALDISQSQYKQIIEKQKNRCELFLQTSKMDIEKAFPIILTFLPNNNEFIDGVPVVSINKLNSFLLEFDDFQQYFYKN